MKVPEKALGSRRRCFKCGEWLDVDAKTAEPVDYAVPQVGFSSIQPQEPARKHAPPAQSEDAPDRPELAQDPHQPAAIQESVSPKKRDVTKLRIGELLVQEGIVTQDELGRALARQKEKGGKLVENLIALDFLDTRTFLNFLSRQPGTASIDLLNYTIPSEVIDLVPAEFALKHELLPIDKMGRQLTVGMACPLDSETVEQLMQMTGMKIRPLLVSMNDIRVALKRYYEPKKVHTFQLGIGSPVPAAPASPRLDEVPAPAPQPAPPPLAVAPPAAQPAAPVEEPEPLTLSEDELDFEAIIQRVREIASLPAYPETVSKVKEAMVDPDIAPTRIAAIIRRDPAIAAKILGLANSAEYGINHTVDSVEMATSLLGLREIYALIHTATVADDDSTAFDYHRFWRRAIICATTAKLLARACGRSDLPSIFAAGLLHDLGRAALAEVLPQRYLAVNQRHGDPQVIAQEQQLFQVAHPEAGYILAKSWKIPPQICEAIRFHHDFQLANQHRDVVAIIALAAFMTDTYGRIKKENVAAFATQCKEMLNALNLAEKDFVPVLAQAAAAIKAELNPSTVNAMEGSPT